MPNVQNEVVDWLHSKQNWLQEAASRILRNGQITEEDIDELTALLKTNEGQATTSTRTFTGLGTATTSESLLLESISEIKGIDNLSPKNPLIFCLDKVTVIYGNNGSGKSGYTRILKKATGKSSATELKHNVFSPPPPADERSCKIKYLLNGNSHEITWLANSSPIEDLKGIDIFDSDNARVYLTKEKETTYTPPIIAFFEELVSVSKRIGEKLDEEKRQLIKSLPQLDQRYINTEAGKLYNSLSATHDEATLTQILTFSDSEELAIKTIRERLQTEDPKSRASKIRKEKVQLDKIIVELRSAYKMVDEESCKRFQVLKQNAHLKRMIATEAIQKNGELSKLDGVGSETWRDLWEAARKYSIAEAYKGESFPKTDGAKCVLCHQDLDKEAQERLKSFEEFVKSSLESDAKQSEEQLKKAIENLPSRPSNEALKTSLEFAGIDANEWLPRLDDAWNTIVSKVEELKISNETVKVESLDVSPIVSELESISLSMEARAIQFDEDAKDFDREKAQKELLELEARQWTSSQRDAILAEVQRLKDIQKLESWKTLTSTRGLSVKASELSESIITNEYVRRFNQELTKLGAKRIKVKLEKTRVKEGVVNHKIRLQDAVTDVPIIDILSEGEQRIIALAAFLADVTGKEESTPFIFDDPISSLDQDFEEKTIERLIELAEDRQVIVFTHRLSFLGIINDKADSLCQVNIRTEPWGSGEVGEIPIFGKKPEKALNGLKNGRLATAKKVYFEQGFDAYYPLAKAICSDFRILLERIVELYFLADVVQRHRRAINTMGKIHSLSKITQDDCDLIDKYMSKYSVYEHSQSAEFPTELPEPDELEQDINTVLTWLVAFRGR